LDKSSEHIDSDSDFQDVGSPPRYQRFGSGLGGLVVSGGVASNSVLRDRLRNFLDKKVGSDFPLLFPPPHLCTDNAAMIAYVASLRLASGRTDSLEVEHRSKWSIEDCESDFDRR